ncbi:MAG: type IVB secretion system protein IcmH/DotU [Psychromonas sp.]|nr:type IVB secretion system protein IcmH/DotU [Psychromonas sp.]
MTDSTIVKPRPGRRSKQNTEGPEDNSESNLAESKPPKKRGGEDDITLIFEPSRRMNDPVEPLLKLSDNPLVDCAGELLTLCCQLMIVESHTDTHSLREECVKLIRNYEDQLKQQKVNSTMIKSAGYCLCCFLDEGILNTEWGGASDWSSDSLLSIFHNQTFGGEQFYTLLDKSIQYSSSQFELVELMYLCLTLGFQGKMRLEDNGARKLEDYRQNAYIAIKEQKDTVSRALSPSWKDRLGQGSELQKNVSLWILNLSFSVLLLVIYLAFNYNTNKFVDPVGAKLETLVAWQKQSKAEENKSKQELLILQQNLQTEIKKGLLTVKMQLNSLRITIGTSNLFTPGSAKPNAEFEAVLFKIARLLENSTGNIIITAHSDNTKISTAKYPSSWYLSLARATTVANILATGGNLNGRLWPEARGDSEPLYPNDTKAHREKNRRVEIDLLVN